MCVGRGEGGEGGTTCLCGCFETCYNSVRCNNFVTSTVFTKVRVVQIFVLNDFSAM